MTAPWRLLALPPLAAEVVRGMFAPLGDAVEVSLPSSRDRAGLLAGLAGAELVVADFTGDLALDQEALAAAPRLAFVQCSGVGTDYIDLDLLAAAKVPVANCAGGNARSVAEWAVAAAFALCRRMLDGDRGMRRGGWPQLELLGRGVRELHTQRVGVIGFGAIGSETARLFGALGCEVSYWSRSRRPAAAATYRDLDDLLPASDILVITLPLTPETRGLLGPERLARLPDGSYLINAARGGIVPDDAVVEALDSGRLAGAALDVYEAEPPPDDHPLRSREDVLLSPHLAGATREAQLTIMSMVRRNIGAAAAGRPVSNVVNGADPVIRRRT